MVRALIRRRTASRRRGKIRSRRRGGRVAGNSLARRRGKSAKTKTLKGARGGRRVRMRRGGMADEEELGGDGVENDPAFVHQSYAPTKRNTQEDKDGVELEMPFASQSYAPTPTKPTKPTKPTNNEDKLDEELEEEILSSSSGLGQGLHIQKQILERRKAREAGINNPFRKDSEQREKDLEMDCYINEHGGRGY